ncbi:MAG: glycosyltransferase family 2 protein, partial [Planctomycetia bacterium]
DVRCGRGWLDALTAVARRRPDFGVLGAWQTDFDGEPSPRTKAIVRGHRGRSLGCPIDPLPDVVPTDWVEGSCLYVRREVLQAVGYLDPLFAPAYFEEIDFCRRVRRAGWQVGLAPAAVVAHHGAGTANRPRGRSRTRTLLERNYALFHAADPAARGGWPQTGWRLAHRSVRHGLKAMATGRLSPMEWSAALAALPARWRALRAKQRRDAAGRPCPILGDGVPTTREHQYYTERVERLTLEYAETVVNPPSTRAAA